MPRPGTNDYDVMPAAITQAVYAAFAMHLGFKALGLRTARRPRRRGILADRARCPRVEQTPRLGPVGAPRALVAPARLDEGHVTRRVGKRLPAVAACIVLVA